MIGVLNYVLLVCAALTCFGLYNVSYETKAAAEGMADVRRQISAEKARIAELEADWAVLNSLQGLQVRSVRYLDLQPVRGEQIMALDVAMARLPKAGQAGAQPAGDPKPLAVAKTAVVPAPVHKPAQIAAPLEASDAMARIVLAGAEPVAESDQLTDELVEAGRPVADLPVLPARKPAAMGVTVVADAGNLRRP